MSSPTRPAAHTAARARLTLGAGLFALALLVTSIFGVAASASAQSIYGGDSTYGTQTYSADTEATEKPVGPPNTGFAVLERAARDQPVLFWGGAVALSAALAFAAVHATKIIKRKQEN